MKFALSIRYGGIPVFAQDCDRASFCELALVCPECYSPVFWREGSTRKGYQRKARDCESSIWVKEASIEACFSHFPEQEEIAQVCEYRLKRVSDCDLATAKDKAIVQRKRAFEQRIQELLMFNPEVGGDLPFLFKAANLDLENNRQKSALKCKKNWCSRLRSYRSELFAQIAQEHFARPVQDRSTLADNLHYQVCQEVATFLLQPKNASLTEDLWLLCLYQAVVYVSYFDGDYQKYRRAPQSLFKPTLLTQKSVFATSRGQLVEDAATELIALKCLARMIYQVDWAEGFAFFDPREATPKSAPALRIVHNQLYSLIFEQELILYRKREGRSPKYLKESFYQAPERIAENGIIYRSLIDPSVNFVVAETELKHSEHIVSYYQEIIMTKGQAEDPTSEVIAYGFSFNNCSYAPKNNGLLRLLKASGLAKKDWEFAMLYPGIYLHRINDPQDMPAFLMVAEYFLDQCKLGLLSRPAS